MMREVCHDVRVEPELLPLENDDTITGNRAQKARLDVSGNGIWGPQEKRYLDIRVMHPNSPSYMNKNISQVYQQHQREKIWHQAPEGDNMASNRRGGKLNTKHQGENMA